MNSAATVSLAILIMITGITVSGQDTSDAARLKRIVIDYNQAEVIIDYPGYEKATALGKQFSVDKVIGGKLHIILSIRTVNQFISLGIPFQIAPPPDESGIKGSSGISKAMTWQSYPSYTQYDSIMHKLAADYPDICRLQTIGTSVSGKQVYVLKISDNVLVEESSEPEVFYSSTMHGDELAGYVLMLRLSEYLIKNYSTDSYVKSLVDNLQIYINPLANPDGTYPTGDAIINPTRFNANNIDLNRNFPDPLQPGIVQQKENTDMIAFMRNHRFVLSANFHSGNEIVNYPWDRWLTKVHADNNWFVTLCRAYADTVHVYSHGDYMDGFDNGIVRGAVWYVITGGRQDFVTWELQGREVTIELDYTKLTPADSLEKMWEYNYRSLLNYLDYSRFGVNGKVTNKETGDPVMATIFITGHDKDSSQVTSDMLTGHYTRLLSGGTWNFTFSASGYRDTTITGIILLPGESVSLDVEMTPQEYPSSTTKLLVMPNPSSGYLEILLPEWLSGEVLIEVYTIGGRMLVSKSSEFIPFTRIPLDLSHLSQGVYVIRARSSSGGLSVVGRAVITR